MDLERLREMAELFRTADRNRDSLIDFDEFLDWLAER